MNESYIIVDNENALLDLCRQLESSSWLALDTEFEREKTYYPELCLLQVSNGDATAIIDPLAINNLEPFLDILYDTSVTKVFHSAHQDLEILFHIRGSVPEPLFDTQIAAPLLGYSEQIGYANLVGEVLGVQLAKAHTRTDWKRRPLLDEQLQYAADDVVYLAELYPRLHQALLEQDRLSWLENDFTAMTSSEKYKPSLENMWLKIRQANRLKGTSLSALQSIASWREETARKNNQPRKWLMRDDLCIDIARLLPENLDALTNIKGLNQNTIKRYGQALLDIINEARYQEPRPFILIEKKT